MVRSTHDLRGGSIINHGDISADITTSDRGELTLYRGSTIHGNASIVDSELWLTEIDSESMAPAIFGNLDLSHTKIHLNFLDFSKLKAGQIFSLLTVSGNTSGFSVDSIHKSSLDLIPEKIKYTLSFVDGSLAMNISAVPEPEHYLLFASSLMCFYFSRRKSSHFPADKIH